jgi:hypothetical protein
MFCALELIFIGTEGVVYRHLVLRSRSRFRRNRARGVLLLTFALLNTFSAVPRVSGPAFKFCDARSVFSGSVVPVLVRTERVESHFYVLRSRTRFRLYRGCQTRFHILCSRTKFSSELRLSVPLLDSFLAGPSSSGPDFMFCGPGLNFDGTMGVGFRFHVFPLPDSFSVEPRASCPAFVFCAL